MVRKRVGYTCRLSDRAPSRKTLGGLGGLAGRFTDKSSWETRATDKGVNKIWCFSVFNQRSEPFRGFFSQYGYNLLSTMELPLLCSLFCRKACVRLALYLLKYDVLRHKGNHNRKHNEWSHNNKVGVTK